MKIGLLMGILLVLTLTPFYIAPKTQAQEPVWDTHTVTVVRCEPWERTITATPTPEPVTSGTYFDKLTGEPVGITGWTTCEPEPEPGFYKLTTCPAPEPSVIHTLSFWTAPERAKLGMNQSWGLEIYPRIPDRLMPSDFPPMPPTDEEVSQLMLQLPATTTIWPAPESVSEISVSIPEPVTVWGPPLEPAEMGIHALTIWSSPGWVSLAINRGWNPPRTFPPTLARPMTLEINPVWNLSGYPYICVGSLQSLFWNLLLWRERLPVPSYGVPNPSIEFPPGPPSDEEFSQLLTAVPTVWPSPEPVSTGVYNVPVRDTHTMTIGLLRAGPFDGWMVLADTITAMWPGPEPHPESEMFYARWPGPEPVMVIHTLSVWTATERAKLGMNQSWGLEMYPRIPHRLMSSDYPPMPPSEEEISQMMSAAGVHTITVPVNTATAWEESPESASLNYEP